MQPDQWPLVDHPSCVSDKRSFSPRAVVPRLRDSVTSDIGTKSTYLEGPADDGYDIVTKAQTVKLCGF